MSDNNIDILKSKIKSIQEKINTLRNVDKKNDTDIEAHFFNNDIEFYEKYPYLDCKINSLSLNQEKPKNNTELDTNKIEELIKNRSLAKANKDFLLADKIRADLKNIGIDLIDKPKGVTEWKQLSD